MFVSPEDKVDAGHLGDEGLIPRQREMRESDHRIDLPLQLRDLLASGDDRRRVLDPRTPRRVDRQADDPQPDRSSTRMDGYDCGSHRPRKRLAVHIGYIAGHDAKTALGEACTKRLLGDVELVIAEYRPIETHVIQDVHHLPARQRLTVDDRRPDCRRREIVAAQCHQHGRLRLLEAPQHCRRAAQTAVTAAFNSIYFVDIVDVENGNRRAGLGIRTIEGDRDNRQHAAQYCGDEASAHAAILR